MPQCRLADRQHGSPLIHSGAGKGSGARGRRNDGGMRLPYTMHFASNRLLATFSPGDRQLIEACATIVGLRRGEVLFEPGAEVSATHFPSAGTVVALVVSVADGRTVEVATIGKEGAV